MVFFWVSTYNNLCRGRTNSTSKFSFLHLIHYPTSGHFRQVSYKNWRFACNPRLEVIVQVVCRRMWTYIKYSLPEADNLCRIGKIWETMEEFIPNYGDIDFLVIFFVPRWHNDRTIWWLVINMDTHVPSSCSWTISPLLRTRLLISFVMTTGLNVIILYFLNFLILHTTQWRDRLHGKIM